MAHSSEDLFKIEKEHEHWASEQKKLAGQVIIPKGTEGYCPKTGDVVLAMDIQYSEDNAHVAGNLHYWQGEHIGIFAGVAQAEIPYVPTFFCFREGPPLFSLIKQLEKQSLSPDVIIVDGHGLAHPRLFGVACWLGVITQKPTIGCAKETLLPYQGDLEDKRGSTVEVAYNDKTTGYVLRNQDGINPIFVSPGHLVSLQNSLNTVLGLPGKYRIPDPLRNSDHAARAHCKGAVADTWKDLGVLE